MPLINRYQTDMSSASQDDPTQRQQEPTLNRTASQAFSTDHSDGQGLVLDAIREGPVYASGEHDHSHKASARAFGSFERSTPGRPLPSSSSTSSTAQPQTSLPDFHSLFSATHDTAYGKQQQANVQHEDSEIPSPESQSARSSRRLKKANRRKLRQTQGDWVLIREMAPNPPDIAQQVSQQALDSDSGESDQPQNRKPININHVGVMRKRPVVSGPSPVLELHERNVRLAAEVAIQDRQNQLKRRLENAGTQSMLDGVAPAANPYLVEAESESESDIDIVRAKDRTEKMIYNAFKPPAQIGTPAIAQVDAQYEESVFIDKPASFMSSTQTKLRDDTEDRAESAQRVQEIAIEPQTGSRPKILGAPKTKAGLRKGALSKLSQIMSDRMGELSPPTPIDLEDVILGILQRATNGEEDNAGRIEYDQDSTNGRSLSERKVTLTKREAMRAVQAISALIKEDTSSAVSQPRSPVGGLNANSVFSEASHTLDLISKLTLASTHQLHSLKPTGTDHGYDDSIYSDVESVFSEVSNISSITGMSVRGFSSEQIAAATRELLSIFQDDETMQSVYKAAIYGDIGPRRFGTVFRKYLRSYARGLKDEAEDSLRYSAAQLVSVKARTIVLAILEKYSTGRMSEMSSDVMEQHSEEKNDSSSGDDDQMVGLDESAFNELTQVRAFWVNSTAFRELQDKLRRFVRLPVPPDSQHEARKDRIESSDNERPRKSHPITGSGDATQIIRSEDTSTSLKHHESAYKQSQSESAAVEYAVTAASTVLLGVLRHMLLCDENLLRLHRMIIERDLLETYAEVLVSFCSTSQWRGKDAFRVTGAPAAQFKDICLSAALGIADDVRALGAQAFSTKDSGHTIGQIVLSRIPDQITLVDTAQTILAKSSMGGLDLAMSSDEETQRQLKMDIAVSLLPMRLHEVLLAGHGHPLKLTSDPDLSHMNQFKAGVEEYTGVEWDWWPLAPRIPNPQLDEVRIEWNFINTRQFVCAPMAEAKILEEVTAIAAIPATRNYKYRGTTAFLDWAKHMKYIFQRAISWWRLLLVPFMTFLVRWSAWFCVPFLIGLPFTFYYLTLWSRQRVNASSQSQASSDSSSNKLGPTPTDSADQDGNKCGKRRSTASQLPVHDKVPSSHVPNHAMIDMLPSKNQGSHRVLFGVQGPRWSLDLEQIPVTSLLNDPTFFRELKKRYKKHRSVLKRIASPFRFRYCRFVKFEKFDVERVISQGDDLPEYPGVTDDYEYAPRPGRNPMITPKTFAVCLKACDSKCKWRLLNPWHDCIRLPPQTYRLRSIPKKKSEFDVHSDDVGLVAWGLEADYAVSFAYVAVYHLVPLLGAFSFWIYWLFRYPSDWQNAAVPALTVLALFAVIWIPLGKLISTA
ncbi:hypothetical protein FB567DRAFT_48711 [Paraphoma chrysanthemicola]|uniref:Uncharacterized protein n=1 Tax=Paraphoma chrysanthemicola TaxID=798071 RepID=A0A8K0W6C1_9PLEO|nr:hypothetical protein FB567DRAFT_48711 [Paraphoma chrysanthemicola]